MGSLGTGLLGELLDLVLPQSCAGCGAVPGLLCPACAGRLTGAAWPAWPTPAPAGLPRPWAVAPYEGTVRAMIIAHKESGRVGLAGPLGAGLARSVLAACEGDPDPDPDPESGPSPESGSGPGPGRDPGPVSRPGTAPVRLVPVPSARATTRRRGHDPARRIADAAVAWLRGRGVPAQRLNALTQARRVADQSGLTAAERIENLMGALTVARPAAVRGDRIVLVDDVITTGATLTEAARALRAAGADVVAAAVVAATRRRNPG